MHSFQHSRGRILFEVACAFGIAASCVGAWQQTYATAMLPAAAIAALYGLVHAFDMVRRRPAVVESVEVIEPAAGQGDLLANLGSSESAPRIEAPEFAEPAAEVVAEVAPKRKRKSSRKAETETLQYIPETEPRIAPAEPDPQPEVVEAAEVTEPEVVELQPAMRVVDTVPDEPEYIPATPLFEPEPFVRQQRAAFGRKAR
jgi:hypothetical protein